jgi:diguanylate cyclase (GGDEF)-like protein
MLIGYACSSIRDRNLDLQMEALNKAACEKIFDDKIIGGRAEPRMAYYDHLTGLPNRQLFSEFLRKSLAHAQRHKLLLAVLFIDLDGFKKINDTLGHTVGDQLLNAVAERLKKNCCRDQDTVARWGGDEFIILLPDLDGAQEAASVAQKIDAAFSQAMVLPDHNLTINLSIGISRFPENGFDEETLIRNADAAMYRAKQRLKFYKL